MVPQSSAKKLAYDKAWYRKNKEKQLAYLKRYREQHKERLRAYQRARYLLQREKPEKLAQLRARYAADPAMRARIQAAAKRWRTEHREEIRAQSRLNEAIRERRMRDNGGTLSVGIRERLWQQQGGVCAWCHQPMTQPEMDHIIPIVRGGRNDETNVQLVCARCNKVKGTQ